MQRIVLHHDRPYMNPLPVLYYFREMEILCQDLGSLYISEDRVHLGSRVTRQMNSYPDFSSRGYQVIQELGHNRAGGRVSYLAISTNQLPVVIKQFQFAQLGVNWSDYDAYEQEIAVLQRLNHPRIPRYLGSFETLSGFCLVQEYKQAPPLADSRHFTSEEVKQVAVAALEVLIYLQQQVPLVIHRDIKPENILVDRQEHLKVYLVDFGFARMGGGEVAVSSAVKGTLGFMPPEQLFNRQLTEASDLYSLGATLVCLLTKIKSTEIGNLIDENYQINCKQLVPQLNPQFVSWLEKMVTPSLKNRFDNAATALQALQPIDFAGKTITPRMQAHVIKFRPRTIVAGLVTLYLVAWVGILTWILDDQWPHDPRVRQLIETKHCPNCDLTNTDLESLTLRNANLSGANLENSNLRDTDLIGANLKDVNLHGVDLSQARLGDTNLEGADLRNANLGDVNLFQAQLRDVNLEGADLRGAHLTSANFENANLKNAKLGLADLGYSNLSGADLENADLGEANLGSTNLRGASLKDASLGAFVYLKNVDLRDADLEDANIQHADLQDANLEGANLQGTKLQHVDLRNANLRGTNLKNAQLSDVNLKNANLNNVSMQEVILRGVVMPDGSKHKLNINILY